MLDERKTYMAVRVWPEPLSSEITPWLKDISAPVVPVADPCRHMN